MNYTFFIEYQSIVTQVFPLNWLECSLIDEKEKDQMFYRRKFNGNLAFGGKKLCEDFMLFWDIEQVNKYGRINLLILQDLNIYWEGYFSTYQGDWDLDAATFAIIPSVTDDYTDFDEFGDVEFNILNTSPVITTEITRGATTWTYTRNRFLLDVIKYIAGQIIPDVVVYSDFLENATNPVTKAENRMLYLTIAHKSDIKRPTSSNPASRAMLSFNGLMEILLCMNLKWSYNLATNILTIEHISFWESTAGIDIRNQDLTQATNKYNYSKEETPKFERFSWLESKDWNFAGEPIRYNIISQENNIIELNLNVTTDIEYIQDCTSVVDEESLISDDGFVLLANRLDGVDYYVMTAGIPQTTFVKFNGDLSWPALHEYYFKHDRYIIEGYINGVLTTFFTAKKTIQQECSIVLCKSFDPEQYITTELGEKFFSEIKAFVKKAIIKPYSEINLSLIYGPKDNDNPGNPPPKVAEVIEYSDAVPSTTWYFTLSEPADADLDFKLRMEVYSAVDFCTTDWGTCTILTGQSTGSVNIVWCLPETPPAICFDDPQWDLTGAPGWSVHVVRDPVTQCI